MRKSLLIIAVALVSAFGISAQKHLLTFNGLYQEILDGITAGTEVAVFNSGSTTKILVNQDRVIDIFTMISPSARTFRLDSCNATFVGGDYPTAVIRLEPNGASNTTNGRKIYIDCPAAGLLTVGCWTATAGRGYTVEDATGTVISNANASMDAAASTIDLPVHKYSIAAAGRIVLNPNAGFYYGFVQFEEGVSAVNSVLANKGVRFNGSEILNPNGLELEVYNVIGSRIATSMTSISTKDLQSGIYIVRAKGMKDALKFSI